MRNVILHSIWQGPSGKKAPFDIVMKELAEQIQNINIHGIPLNREGQARTVRIAISAITADLQARAQLAGIVAPNGFHACLFCEIEGDSFDTAGNGSARFAIFKCLFMKAL